MLTRLAAARRTRCFRRGVVDVRPFPGNEILAQGYIYDAGMSKPSLADLESWIAECTSSVAGSPSITVLKEHADEFLLLFGLVGRTMRYADAYMELMSGQHSLEAVPLARAALEHAVTLQWVFLTDGGVDRFRREVAHGHVAHYQTLADWLKNDDLHAAVADLRPAPAGKRMPPFMNMVRDLDDGKFLETTYHILSQQVHVTHTAVTSFLGWDAGASQVALVADPEYPYRYEATYAVAAACMLARWPIAKFGDDASLLEHLDATSDRLVLPMNLLEHLAPGRRRTGL